MLFALKHSILTLKTGIFRLNRQYFFPAVMGRKNVSFLKLRNISKNLGAIGIENEKIMIAMVEDTPDHIAKLSEVLGHSDYEIIFCTVTQLRELQRSCYD